jgi:D-alanyl-D-alanine carboxypeptidase
LLIPSSNDAALILSHHIPGGTAQFVEQMNQKAAELGLIHTHFGDPAGLEDDMNYTTPRDLMRLAMYAWQDPIIRTIVGKSDHTITTRNGKSYRVFTTNSLLGTYGITGLKTGRTIGAKEVFISVFPYKDRQIFSIVMRSNDRFGDTKLLIDQMLSRLTYLPIPLEVPGRMP